MSVFTRLNSTSTAKWKALCELADAVNLYRLVIDQEIDASAHLDDHLEKLEHRYRTAADAHDREKIGV